MACVLHASDRGIFVESIESVGKQTRDESGKHPVNEDDEGILRRVRAARRCKVDDSAGSIVEYHTQLLKPSLRAERSNPQRGITG